MNDFIKKALFALLASSVGWTLPGCEGGRGELGIGRCITDNYYPFDSTDARPTSFVIGDVGYIQTGGKAKTQTKVSYFWGHDSKTKVWSQLASFPGTVPKDTDHFTYNGKAYIVDKKDKSDVWEYSPLKNEWNQMSIQLVKNNRPHK